MNAMRLSTRLSVLLPILPATVLVSSCADYHLGSIDQPNPSRQNPVITWPQPAPITDTTPLSSAELDATANVPGTFLYIPAAGTVLPAGVQKLSATFTPADSSHYNPASASVSLTVRHAESPAGGVGVGRLAVSDLLHGRVLLFDAPFTTGQSASAELGQANFTSHDFSDLLGRNRLFGPWGLSSDGAGNLYVADVWNYRVVQFQPPFANNMDANLFLGVPAWNTVANGTPYECGSSPPENLLCMPADVVPDGTGNLWVADSYHGRVVKFEAPISSGMAASIAVGQPDFAALADCDGVSDWGQSPTPPPFPPYATGAMLCRPVAVAFDKQGNLWVADNNDRVLEYPAPISTGMSAALELGYPADIGLKLPLPRPECRNVNPSASSFCGPGGLAFDPSGNLWVVDSEYNRVLEFKPPFTSGMSASVVIGQQDMYAGEAAAPAANTLSVPQGLTFDAAGNLYVSDEGNNRVLIFVPPFTSGMNAFVALGRPDLTSSSPTCLAPAANTLCRPAGLLSF